MRLPHEHAHARRILISLLLILLALPLGLRAQEEVSGVPPYRAMPTWADTTETGAIPGRVGPLASDTGRTLPGEPTQEEWKDPWGQPRNIGLATGALLLSNFVPWLVHELPPGQSENRISQLSVRSWWRNLETGWQWDDNAVQWNFFAHPAQGSLYFNAARSNGYGYWTGLLFAALGSFQWECCGETHYMSLNDWITTSIGGAAVGETMYRLSSWCSTTRLVVASGCCGSRGPSCWHPREDSPGWRPGPRAGCTRIQGIPGRGSPSTSGSSSPRASAARIPTGQVAEGT